MSRGTNPAIESSWVPDAVRRERRLGQGLLFAGVVLFAIFAATADYYSSQSDQLRSSGGRAAGVIAQLRPDTGNRSGAAQVDYVVGTHRFREHVDLGADADHYHVGQRVTVYYDKQRPSHMTIDSEDNQPAWTVWPMILALLGGAALMVYGPVVMVRSRRNRRALARHPWRETVGREVRASGRGRYVLLDGEGILRAGLLSRWSSDWTGSTTRVLVCGHGKRVVVAVGQFPRHVRAARPPRSPKEEARWRANVTRVNARFATPRLDHTSP